MNAYSILLHAHSGFRWLVLLMVVVAVLKSLFGMIGNGQYAKFDKVWASAFVGFMDIQFLLGILLYFLSPIVQSAWGAGMGNMMADSTLRFWGMEHLVVMILAIAAAHIGKVKAKKASSHASKFRAQLVFFGVSLALMLFGIPWERL